MDNGALGRVSRRTHELKLCPPSADDHGDVEAEEKVERDALRVAVERAAEVVEVALPVKMAIM